MLGFEPGDISGAAVVMSFTEAHESAHLVDVAADTFGQALDLANQRIGLVLHQPRLSQRPVEQSMKQGKALATEMKERRSREVDKGSPGSAPPTCHITWSGGTWSSTRPRTASRQPVKIVLRLQRDDPHQRSGAVIAVASMSRSVEQLHLLRLGGNK